LLLWWAIERHAIAARDETVKLFSSPAAWGSALMRETILTRLMRRYAAEGTEATLEACGQILKSAPSTTDRQKLLVALDQGLQERTKTNQVVKTPTALESQLEALSAANSVDPVVIGVAARLGEESAYDRALKLADDTGAPAAARISTLDLIGEMMRVDCVSTVLKLIGGTEPDAIQIAALAALQHFDRAEIGDTLLRDYPRLHPEVRSHARDLLFSRKAWALAFLRQVDSGNVSAKEVPVEQLQKIALHNDKQLNDLVRKNWGSITGGTPGEVLAVVRRFNNDIRAAPGDPAHGHELFKKTCAVCHELFGEGEKVGPELTHANRQDRDFLLVSIVDPSAVIRKEFLSYNVETSDGRQLSGLIAEQMPNSITLVAAKNERTTIARDQIKTLQESPVSLMPEGLLNGLKPQELRDLFSYLEKK
jgi:putative heme-binding domain-containing protein